MASRENEQKSILEHVGELRRKILIAAGATVIGAVIAHIFHREIIVLLLTPAGGNQLIFLSPLEPILFILKIDIIGGLILAFPIISWAVFSFIAPSLTKKTASLITVFYFSSFLLLIGGILYAYFVTIPISLNFLFSIVIPGIENQFSAQNYISFFLTQTLIIMGVFQIPILISSGVYLGVFNTRMLTAKRRYTYLIMIIALAIVTPTSDILSLLIVFIPCMIIFEGSIIIGKLIERSKRRRARSKIEVLE